MTTHIENLRTDTLVPYATNSRTHSEDQVAQIAASIREFGFTNPVLIDKDGTIIAGHGRVMAARKLGLDTVPCIRLDHLSPQQVKAYVLADNKLALNAGWDSELLKVEIETLKDGGFDMKLLGFTPDELDGILLGDDSVDSIGNTDDDDVPELREDAVSKPGDVWIMGTHRLICGDCTISENIRKLTRDEPCDACWTDPPYNVNYEGGNGKKIANDSMKDEAFRKFLYDAYVSMFLALKEGAPIYVAHADTEGLNFRGAFKDAGFKLSGCLIWVKPSLVLGRSDYQWRHEPILYGWKPGAAHTWYGGRAKTTVVEASAESPLTKMPDGRWRIDLGATQLIISGNDIHVEETPTTVIRVEKPRRNGEHPTMKPIELILPMLKNSTRRGGGSAGFVRRFRIHPNRLREVWTFGEAVRAGFNLCRRHHPSLAGVHREKGCARIRWEVVRRMRRELKRTASGWILGYTSEDVLGRRRRIRVKLGSVSRCEARLLMAAHLIGNNITT